MKSLNALDKLLVLTKLKSKNKIQINIQIPMDIYNDIALFKESCKLNGTNINGLFSLIFINGYSLYKNYLELGIDGLLEINFVISYFQKIYRELTQYSTTDWVMNNEAIKMTYKLCKHSQLGNFNEFIEFINKHRLGVIGDRILLTETNIITLFEKYLEQIKHGK